MRYPPKHLHRHYRGKKRRVSVIILGIGIIGVIICVGFIIGCNVPEEEVSEATPSAALATPSEDVSAVSETPETTSEVTPEITATPEPEPEPLYTEEDLTAMVTTLAGECYDCETQDKYNVAWTIINRVRDGRFGGDTVLQVVSCTQYGVQFTGYWKQSRSVSDDDYAVAEDVLTSYYLGEDAPVDYLYFSSNGGTTNTFR